MSRNENFDKERYYNDPEYRKQVRSADKDKNSDKKPDKLFGRFSFSGISRYLIYGIGVILLCVIGYVIYLVSGLPPIEELENPKTAIASEVRSRDGVALDRFFVEDRRHVSIDEISPNVVNALVATEDHRFFNHWGMDMVRTLAIPYHILRGDPQGGSTISQQLARNLYRSIGREFSYTRKFREMITAVDIENNYTKREIIELYLNTVEFSNSAYGIESAALRHFNKPARDLTVTESATLIGQLKAVSTYNPRSNPGPAQQRRNTVLYQMEKRGFISNEIYQNLTREPIALNYQLQSQSGRESRYFGEYVLQKVLDWTEENGYDIYSDGLVIHTTIDSRLQRYAEESVRTNLIEFQEHFELEWTSVAGRNDGEYMDLYFEEYPQYLNDFIRDTDRYKNAFSEYDTDQESVVFDTLYANEAFIDSVKRARTRLQASFVAIDPVNGGVLAWVGGSDYGNKQFDHVYQSRRQTGSTFKPFVYAVAVDNNYEPWHRFSKYPISFIDRQGGHWNPSDPRVPDGPEEVPLRAALARSLNNVTVRLLPEIAGNPGTNRLEDLIPGARKICEMASSMGIDMNCTQAVPSIALGTAESSLLELVSAYTTFANEGVRVEPIAITRIEDKEGNILEEFRAEYRQEVISPATAYIMIDMLRGVIRGGVDAHGNTYNGTGVRLGSSLYYNVSQDVAGKTGTTQNSADNWFVAMMPHIVMGSWVGGEDRHVRFPTEYDPRRSRQESIGQGARTALPIVGSFIEQAREDPEVNWSTDSFQPPAGFVMPEEPNPGRPVSRDPTQGRIDW